ncbi:MAG: putative zinc-binding metallopeptidase [Planctomycetales bacterium]|nr:putative zinc-binding metallopeptidase [Planctomycetales bacterium]
MGHVVNYAYKLYEQEEWIKTFGSITQPYAEAYNPKPFSRKFVRHLPGWYAQKHPDEDWAETFAVWMTPQSDWRTSYASWPNALAKLEYCDRVMLAVKQQDPLVTAAELDEDVSELGSSLEEYYRVTEDLDGEPLPPGLDGALQAIFEDFGDPAHASAASRRPAAALLLQLERELAANVYRWSGHFPEATRKLIRHLAKRARELKQVYPTDQEPAVIVAVTTLITTLAMNHVIRGSYIP